MRGRRFLTIAAIVAGVFVIAVVVLALLGPVVGNVFSDTTQSYAPSYAGEQTGGYAGQPESAVAPAPTFSPMPTGTPAAVTSAGGGGGLAQPAVPQQRLIIRSADISLVVDDAQAGIEQITDMTNAMGGFVVSSNVYQAGEGALRGDISLRVPAERFDEALDELRDMAVEVERESISGQDVTEEYVDL